MPGPRRRYPVLIGFSVATALVGAAAGVLYLFPGLQATKRSLALASSFLPYAVFAWILAIVIMLVATSGRSLWLVLPLVAGLLAQSLMIAAYYDPSHRAPAGAPVALRVISLNMHYGQADLGQVLAQVERVQPDVLVLTEFTEQAGAVLTSPEWTALLPYHVGTTAPRVSDRGFGDPSGTQVLSRTPLTELARTQNTRATSLAVSLDVGGRSLVLVAAHPANPLSEGLDGWLRESQDVINLTKPYAAGPLVVAGDLNSVPEHYTTRNLLAATGLHECLAGWQPTYPADRLVPLIRIDHVLASAQFSTVSMDTFEADGSDHRGVIAELAWP